MGWEEIPLICPDTFFLLVTWFTFNLYMSLFARALPHHLAFWVACVFEQVGGVKGGRGIVRMCVDIAVCVQRGLLIGDLEVLGTTEISSRISFQNERAGSE